MAALFSNRDNWTNDKRSSNIHSGLEKSKYQFNNRLRQCVSDTLYVQIGWCPASLIRNQLSVFWVFQQTHCRRRHNMASWQFLEVWAAGHLGFMYDNVDMWGRLAEVSKQSGAFPHRLSHINKPEEVLRISALQTFTPFLLSLDFCVSTQTLVNTLPPITRCVR